MTEQHEPSVITGLVEPLEVFGHGDAAKPSQPTTQLSGATDIQPIYFRSTIESNDGVAIITSRVTQQQPKEVTI